MSRFLSLIVMNLHMQAKELRRNATPAERILWRYLANKNLAGYKFRRQAVVQKMFIADFYCASCKLIIEIDGGVHNLEEVKQKDKQRTKILNEVNYHVIRFTNEEVLVNASHVSIKILRVLEELK